MRAEGPQRYLWIIYTALVFIVGYVLDGVVLLIEAIVRRIRRRKKK